MKRYLEDEIIKDLQKKMVFITGPRQIGKTFLAKSILGNMKNGVYLNNDDIDDAKVIKKRTWQPDAGLVVLDEIHKMKGWKNYLKGVFDTRRERQSILVTGSARLDTFRQSGESLAGRYFLYRLNPLSVKELSAVMKPSEALVELDRLGGFPEPFFSASADDAARWRKQYYTDLIREDIFDIGRIGELRAVRLLLELLRKRVGSPVSYTSLSQDMQVSVNTVKRYIDILESLHIIFIVRPFHNNIARAILKEPKIYFYDSGYVDAGEGIRFENTAAVCLLKHLQYLQDSKGAENGLHYLRTKEGKEIDFVISDKGRIITAIEAKLSDENTSKNMVYFRRMLPDIDFVQLVKNARRDTEENGIKTVNAAGWLAELKA
jgi:predicted AAA+ superfamily ATPase